MSKKAIYLDHAAATPVDAKVLAEMLPYLTNKFYNPSANYLAAKYVSKDVEKARDNIAYWLGCKSSEVVFTAGGTEANNLAINGILEEHPGSNIVFSAIEHESVVEPSEKYSHKKVEVKKDGIINFEKLVNIIDDNTVLISVMYANNEIGTVQPIHKISKLIKEIRKNRKNDLPLLLHVDACQAPLYLDLHVSGLGLDLMTLNSGKIYGPKQFGALYISRNVKLKPQILGGGQEKGMRSGTENPANIVGFSKALKIAQTNKLEESMRLKELQNYFINLISKKIPEVIINGSLTSRLPNNVNITISGIDNEIVLMKLDEQGIQCSSGSACNANTDDVSQTLLAIGLAEKDIRSSLRFTMGRSTTKSNIEYVVDSLVKILG